MSAVRRVASHLDPPPAAEEEALPGGEAAMAREAGPLGRGYTPQYRGGDIDEALVSWALRLFSLS